MEVEGDIARDVESDEEEPVTRNQRPYLAHYLGPLTLFLILSTGVWPDWKVIDGGEEPLERLCHGAVLGRWHLDATSPGEEARTMNSMALKTCRGLVHGLVCYTAQERLKLVNPVALDDTLLANPMALLSALRDKPTLNHGVLDSFEN